MNKNIKNIIKEKLIRVNLSKKEIFKQILKSINQNNNIDNSIKIYSNYILNRMTKKNFFLSKKHKICIITGKRNGVFKNINFSRYTIKKLILGNKLTNLKKDNW